MDSSDATGDIVQVVGSNNFSLIAGRIVLFSIGIKLRLL